MTLHIYPVIRGILCNVKARAAKMYTRNCYELVCKKMSFESMYVVKGEKQKQGGVEEPIYYWLQDVERENTWYIMIKHAAHEIMYCSSMKLESTGIPYHHMFVVMKYAKMK